MIDSWYVSVCVNIREGRQTFIPNVILIALFKRLLITIQLNTIHLKLACRVSKCWQPKRDSSWCLYTLSPKDTVRSSNWIFSKIVLSMRLPATQNETNKRMGEFFLLFCLYNEWAPSLMKFFVTFSIRTKQIPTHVHVTCCLPKLNAYINSNLLFFSSNDSRLPWKDARKK